MNRFIYICNTLALVALSGHAGNLIEEISEQRSQEAIAQEEVVIRTVDGNYYKCLMPIVDAFVTIKNVVEDLGKANPIQLPNIESSDLNRLAKIFNEFSQHIFIKTNEREPLLEYLNEMDQIELAKLIVDINYFDIKILFPVVLQVLAKNIATSTTLFPTTFGKKSITGLFNQKIARRVIEENDALEWNNIQVSQRKLVRNIRGGIIHSIAQSNCGGVFAVAYNSGIVEIWRKGGIIKEIPASSFAAAQVSFSPCGKWLAVLTPSDDDQLKIYRTDDYELFQQIKIDFEVISFAFSPDGKKIATANDNLTTTIWNISNAQLLNEFTTSGDVTSVSFSPNGKILAVGRLDGLVTIFHLNGKTPTSFGCLIGASALAFSPDGTKIAVGFMNGVVRIYQKDGTPIWQFDSNLDHNEMVFAVAFSHDGKLLASSSADDKLILWEVASGIQKNKFNERHIYSISFSQRKKAFVTNGLKFYKPKKSKLSIQQVQVLGWKRGNVELDKETQRKADEVYQTIDQSFLDPK